ncbi:ornithine cyclodeaminase family protein [Gemmobacter sp.]|uniref:ornithine cyclodeaminase family protein n=1 Tax=Gemmobacter sp. TaxID=1898957 RepID=UPI002AFDF154|nr:ornithine cyclodeaminase family protein [Gemmobacter sp.]
MDDRILYLSAGDIAALGLGAAQAEVAVTQAFRAKADGDSWLIPKASIPIAGGDVVQALVGALRAPPVSGVKWLSVRAGNGARGLPNIHGLIVLSDLETGQTRAMMDAGWITATRTAACTGIAARHLARAGSRRAGFVGAGLQARSNLDALRLVLPDLAEVTVFGRSAGSLDSFSAHAAAAGLVVHHAATAEQAVRGMDVVVTSVPPATGLKPFLDPRWLAPGSFLSAVDLGRTWDGAQWDGAFDLVATDDAGQSREIAAQGKLVSAGPYHAEIGDLVTGRHPGRQSDSQRTCLLFAGIALADLALASEVATRARAAGLGTLLAP